MPEGLTAVPSALLLIGSGACLVGTFAETRAVHVPMNDALARVDAVHPDAAGEWRDDLSRWTAWNHVRTVASGIAPVAFALAL